MIIFEQKYSGESIIDLCEDLSDMFDPYCATKEAKTVPQDKYGIHKGTFIVTVTWVEDDLNDEDE
jgi:hypothetical protein